MLSIWSFGKELTTRSLKTLKEKERLLVISSFLRSLQCFYSSHGKSNYLSKKLNFSSATVRYKLKFCGLFFYLDFVGEGQQKLLQQLKHFRENV